MQSPDSIPPRLHRIATSLVLVDARGIDALSTKAIMVHYLELCNFRGSKCDSSRYCSELGDRFDDTRSSSYRRLTMAARLSVEREMGIGSSQMGAPCAGLGRAIAFEPPFSSHSTNLQRQPQHYRPLAERTRIAHIHMERMLTISPEQLQPHLASAQHQR